MPVKSLKRFIHRNVVWPCCVVAAVAQQGAPAKVSSSHRYVWTGHPVPPTPSAGCKTLRWEQSTFCTFLPFKTLFYLFLFLFHLPQRGVNNALSVELIPDKQNIYQGSSLIVFCLVRHLQCLCPYVHLFGLWQF